MKNPRRLLWLLLPAAFGVISVSIGFSVWQLNYVEVEGGHPTESLYSVTFNYKDGSGTNKTDTISGLEYTSDFDLKVLPDVWGTGTGTFAGWKVGVSSSNVFGTPFTNSDPHTVKDLWAEYPQNQKPDGKAINLWAQWSD